MALTAVVPAPTQLGEAVEPYRGETALALPTRKCEEGGSALAPIGAIKPYCGAPVDHYLAAEDSRIGELQLYGYPVPAWADVGIASHMRGIGDLADGSQGKKKVPQVLRATFDASRFSFRLLLALASLAENVACWLTYLEIRNPHYFFYNKFEAYALGVEGLDKALAAAAVLNTLYLFAFWVITGVLQLDLHRTLALFRLVLSTWMAIICLIAVFFAEGSKVAPFACTLCSLLHLQVLFYGGLLAHQGKIPSRRKKVFCTIGLVVFACLTLGWLLTFLLDGMAFLREDACLTTKNRAMPVRLQGIGKWQCATWGSPHYIDRSPQDGANVVQALCETSFHELDQREDVSNGTMWRPSQNAHLVQCPRTCQESGWAVEVVGCQVYDARSSICGAAVQMGLVDAKTGGLVKVVGREVPSTPYMMCNLRGVVSVADPNRLDGSKLLQSRLSNDVNVSSLPAAFYFQEVDGMKEHDMVMLHGFRQTSRPGPKKPYEHYLVDVSWRIGGSELQRQEVQLGPAGSADAPIELNFCHGDGPAPNKCE